MGSLQLERIHDPLDLELSADRSEHLSWSMTYLLLLDDIVGALGEDCVDAGRHVGWCGQAAERGSEV